MIVSQGLVAFTRLLVGAQASWATPDAGHATRQRIYFANHTSHLDSVAIWSALPPALRRLTRPVAAKDYWGQGGVRTWFADHGLHAVYIERGAHAVSSAEVPVAAEGLVGPWLTDPPKAGLEDRLSPLCKTLDEGASLILFPEGTRGNSRLPVPFKAGLFHLAERYPSVELVPTYLDTLHRSMPKGCILPLPLHCTVRFGAGLQVGQGESKEQFLARAHEAVTQLAGQDPWS